MKLILVQLNKTLNNYDVGQHFLMKCRALHAGNNFTPLGYHGGNHAVQLNGADCMEKKNIL